MDSSLGNAVLDLTTDASGLARGLADAEKETKGALGRIGGLIKGAAKVAVGATAVVAGFGAAVGAIAIKGGLARALNIEDAQAKLRGLGHDAQSVENIMESALQSVRGTAFGLDAAATAAANAVAAGVEPGEELTRVLSLTADAATIMGRDFGEAGAIINKVLASNRLTMQEVNQLHNAGLPILSMLADQYGVTAEAMREMISEGVVGSEELLAAFENNIAGAALESGSTVRGAAANMGAALSRLGEAVVGPLLPVFRKTFGELTTLIDRATDWVKDNLVPAIQTAADAFMEGEGLIDSFKRAIEALTGGDLLGNFGARIREIFSGFGSGNFDWSGLFEDLTAAAQTAFQKLITWLSTGGLQSILNWLLQSRQRLFDAALQMFPAILDAATQFIPTLLDYLANDAIPSLLDLLVSAVPDLLDAALTLFHTLVDAVSETLPQVVGVLLGEVLPEVMATIIGMVPDILEAGLEAFLALVTAVLDMLPDLLRTLLVDLLPAVLRTIVGMVPRLLTAGVEAFLALVDAVIRVLPELVGVLLGEVLPTLVTTVVGMAPELIIAMFDAAVQMAVGIIDAIPSLLDVIIFDVIPALVKAIIDAVPQIVKAGADLIGGLVKGIKDSAGRVVDTIKRWITDKIPSWIKKPLGIKSPSTLTMGYGRDFIRGFALGIEGATGMVREALAGVTDAAADIDVPAVMLGDVLAADTAVAATVSHLVTNSDLAPAGGRGPVIGQVHQYGAPEWMARQLADELAYKIAIA